MKNDCKKMVKIMEKWINDSKKMVQNYGKNTSIVSGILDTNGCRHDNRMSAASDATNREDNGSTHTMQGMMDKKHYFTMSLT